MMNPYLTKEALVAQVAEFALNNLPRASKWLGKAVGYARKTAPVMARAGWDATRNAAGEVPGLARQAWQTTRHAAGEVPGLARQAWQTTRNAAGEVPGMAQKVMQKFTPTPARMQNASAKWNQYFGPGKWQRTALSSASAGAGFAGASRGLSHYFGDDQAQPEQAAEPQQPQYSPDPRFAMAMQGMRQ